jgi:hypothetical protein
MAVRVWFVRFGTLIARKSSAAAPAAASTPAASAPAVRALRVRYRHWWWLPGWTFAAVTLFPALLAIAWLVPGVALLLAGRFASVPMLIMFPALTLALGYFVLRQLPVSWPRFRENPKRKEPAARRPDVPLDVLILVIAVAAGYFVWQLAMSSQDVIVTSDAGAFLQYAYWIAGHGTAHISQSAFAFGGTVPGANFASYGFYQTGATITPAFMAGLRARSFSARLSAPAPCSRSPDWPGGWPGPGGRRPPRCCWRWSCLSSTPAVRRSAKGWFRFCCLADYA